MHNDPKLPLAPADDSAALADVVDARDGLERIMGDRLLYARMLARFRDDYSAGTVPIAAALAKGERELAHRITHTLMGAAGMIGAHRLHAQAAVAERAIRTGQLDDALEVERLAPELALVRQHIDALIAAMPPAASSPAPVAATMPLRNDAALLAQLTTLLENGDGAAIDVLEASRLSLQVVLGDAALAEVLAATHDFDFARALGVLSRG